MPRKNQYFGGIIGASPLVDTSFDITFTVDGAGGGKRPGYGNAGGAGGRTTATFSSAALASTFKIVVGSGGVSYVDNAGVGLSSYNTAAATTTTANSTVLYGLPGNGPASGYGGGGGRS